MKFNSKNENILKFLIIVTIYILFLYFFIIKNIIICMNLKDNIKSQKIINMKYRNENIELKKSLFSKKRYLRKKLEEKKKEETNSDGKLYFNKISDFFNFIYNHMNKNNILFKSFARSQKDGNNITISFSFSAFERDIINFFSALENNEYYIALSKNYFSINSSGQILDVQLSINFKINNSREDSKTLEKILSKKEIFIKKYEETRKKSYMHINGNNYYRSTNIK